MLSTSVIITAGGLGKRMNSSLPKQFILILDKPVLMHTIESFYHFNPKFEIILTLPEEWHGYWESLLTEHDFQIPHRVVKGGDERYHSVKNALDYCHGDIVFVHDGVRPVVHGDIISSCMHKIRKCDGVIPVIPVYESLRIQDGEGTKSVDRSLYNIVQTPQCFKQEVIREAYKKPVHSGVFDDASLVEMAGYTICTVHGSKDNIKITHQGDLKIAELLLK